MCAIHEGNIYEWMHDGDKNESTAFCHIYILRTYLLSCQIPQHFIAWSRLMDAFKRSHLEGIKKQNSVMRVNRTHNK